MKKKLLILCVLVVLVLGLAANAYAAENVVITAASVTKDTKGEDIKGGSQVQVPVTISGAPAGGYKGFAVAIDFDRDSMTLNKAKSKSVTQSVTGENDWDFSVLTFSDYGVSAAGTMGGNGTLFVIVFDVKEGAAGNLSVTLSTGTGGKTLSLVGSEDNLDELNQLRFEDGTVTVAHDHVAGEPETTAATCTQPGKTVTKCTICNEVMSETTTDALGHDYGDWSADTATCTEGGSQTRTCKRNCGEDRATDTRQTQALGHDYQQVGEVTYPEGEFPCSAEGTKTLECSRCKDTKTETVAKVEHTWDEGQVVKEATETEKGTKLYTCTVCGETKTEDIPALGSDKTDNTSKGNGTAPKTGDESNIALWVVLFVVCAAVVTVVATKKLRKN